MSDPSPSPLSPDSTDPTSGTGFKSFWKGTGSSKSDRSAAQNNVTFVQQDPSGVGKKGNRISRFLKRGSTSTTASGGDGDEADSPGDGKTSAQKRRQQVYQAQKRHRNRKAEYVHNLEAEIARLQSMDAQAHVEKNALAHQNRAMKELLASHSLDFRLENMNILPENQNNDDALSSLGSASIEVRSDSQLGGKDRTFIDWPDEMIWSTEESATVSPPPRFESPAPQLQQQQQQQQVRRSPIKGDSWAAVDFILALEYPCQDHLPHHGINPGAKPMLMETEDSSGFTGHQLCMTSYVYDAAQPAHGHSHGHQHAGANGGQLQGEGKEQRWQLPHTEIEKLVKMSSNLPIDEEEITPAQAYSAIRDAVPSGEMLKPCLDALKLPLSGIVECRGFGTVMPTDMFRQYLHTTLMTLGLKAE